MNIYYDEFYQKEREKYLAVFEDKYIAGEESTEILSEDYNLKTVIYSGEIEGRNIIASKNSLYLKNENIYTYYNFDSNNCEFSSIFTHQDGKNYMVFRTDLYGYSVLDLDTKKDFHYMPASYEKGIESFIWTDIVYNIENNILLTYGCYWACPWSLMVLDFSNPMQENNQFDIQDIINEINYENYEDIESYRFEGRDIIVNIYNCNIKKREEKRIKESEYLKYIEVGL